MPCGIKQENFCSAFAALHAKKKTPPLRGTLYLTYSTTLPFIACRFAAHDGEIFIMMIWSHFSSEKSRRIFRYFDNFRYEQINLCRHFPPQNKKIIALSRYFSPK